MINIILMAHGRLASAMLKTAKDISGLDTRGVRVFSTSYKCDCSSMGKKVEKIFEKSKGRGVLVLADMFGGSACNVPLAAARGREDVGVISGLNLSMLLAALQHRRDMDIRTLTKKIEAEGLRSIINASEVMSGRGFTCR